MADDAFLKAQVVAAYTKGYEAGLAESHVNERVKGREGRDSGLMFVGEGSFGRVTAYPLSAIAYKSTLYGPDVAGRRALYREFQMSV